MPVITVEHLQKRFNLEAGFFARFGRFVYAVNDISFHIGENETYGLVGESGCGKTTTARLLVRMYESDGGSIIYRDSADVRALERKALKQYREKVKYVFQDPARSLNPRMTVYEVLVSGYRGSSRWPGGADGEQRAREEAAAILEEVGLGKEDLERRPSEFSGGQRQRISIARGLLMQPDLLICDEVVSALDVSIQGQILNLLLDIRERRGLSFLFITHDLKVAGYFCDRIGVMYQGELMEEAPAAELYRHGLHPYTKLLFSSVNIDGTAAGAAEIKPRTVVGPQVKNAPAPEGGEFSAAGCPFAERCPLADKRCLHEHPGLFETALGHLVRCLKVI
jgi:oligopeptide/dipeptide ABC transporter ATP-binding protein